VVEARSGYARAVDVGVHVFAAGLYRAPVFKPAPAGTPMTTWSAPPQMIISVPVQTAECPSRALGAFDMAVGAQLSVDGLYLAPVSKGVLRTFPPQITMTLPVQTAVCNQRADAGPAMTVAAHVSLEGS
jgi:hypothetical protein